jgi:PAS domain S-box-containing protein
MMPLLDGFGLLQALRDHERTKTLPILLLSARAGEESRVEGLNAGADDYLTKPFTARELLARVDAHLSLARMRRQADQARRLSEVRLGLALDATGLLAWHWDPVTDELKSIGDMPRIFGAVARSAAEAFGFLHPDDVAAHRAKVERVAREGGSYHSEFRIRRADTGAMSWLEERATGITEDGRVVAVVGVIADVSERKQAEAQLRHQWQTFDTALSNTPDLLCNFDLRGRFTYANRALLTLWQQPLEAILGKNTFDLGYPPELAERLQRQVQDVIATRQPVRDFTPFAGASGEARTYEYIFAPVLSESGSVEAVSCSARDITERERMEQALAASRERLHQIFQQAPVAIVVFRGADYVVELANPHYQALFQGRDLVGRRFFVDVVPDVDPRVRDAFDHVMNTGEPFVANDFYVPYDQDGDGVIEDHWFNVVYHPLRESDASVSGLVAVCSEVTVQVLARKEVERVNRELEEFAYVASHDLQEPLRMVNIFTQQILRRLEGQDPELEHFAGFVRQGVARMQALIQDLLTYSRTVQRNEVRVGTADLAASLGEAMSVLRNRIEESGAVVNVPSLPLVQGDTAQLAHVFLNLLSNALKYRKPDTVPEISITAEQTDGEWIIAVSDNGIGFEQKYAERIFGLFKRLHKDEYPGTGLGLAICQRIVERCGGRMWAAGSPGVGATFYFALLPPEKH